jgi:hypothetical protein
MPKYPNVTVELVGHDGNAWSILARVSQALRQAGVSGEEISAYLTEATSSTYDNLLQVTMCWLEVS